MADVYQQRIQTLLSTLFPGVPAYYRPSGNISLPKPSVVYEQVKTKPKHANNAPYTAGKEFKITFLSNLPGMNTDSMRDQVEVVVVSNNSFVYQDIVNDVYNVIFQ